MSEKKKQFAKEGNQSYESVPTNEGYNEIIEGVRYEMQPSSHYSSNCFSKYS